MHDWTLPTSTPGAGIWEPARKTTMIIRTNSSLRRRSGVRKAFANAVSTRVLYSCSARVPSLSEHHGSLTQQVHSTFMANGQATVVVPPAASIFSLAEAENAWAVTETL